MCTQCIKRAQPPGPYPLSPPRNSKRSRVPSLTLNTPSHTPTATAATTTTPPKPATMTNTVSKLVSIRDRLELLRTAVDDLNDDVVARPIVGRCVRAHRRRDTESWPRAPPSLIRPMRCHSHTPTGPSWRRAATTCKCLSACLLSLVPSELEIGSPLTLTRNQNPQRAPVLQKSMLQLHGPQELWRGGRQADPAPARDVRRPPAVRQLRGTGGLRGGGLPGDQLPLRGGREVCVLVVKFCGYSDLGLVPGPFFPLTHLRPSHPHATPIPSYLSHTITYPHARTHHTIHSTGRAHTSIKKQATHLQRVGRGGQH